jgi:hypothetical protein
MEGILEIIGWIEKHPVVGTALLGAVGYTIHGLSKSIISWFRKENVYVGSMFWTLEKKYRVTALHKYEPSNDISGYRQIQHSRPDQWRKLIQIKSSLFGLRHVVVPLNKDDVLAVIISRNGQEIEKVINFNRWQ